MMRTAPRLPLAALTLAAASLMTASVVAPVSAHAQGTEEQQEACTPDAVKLCQNTIPDIPKTEACMKAHYAQLSPRCQRAFNDVTGGGSKKEPPADTAHREDVPPHVAVVPREDQDDPGAEYAAPESPTRAYAAQIRTYCRDGLIDPFTCRNTLGALRGAE